jgi:hypothetical protein
MDEIVSALARQMERDFRAAGTLPGRCAQGEARNYGFFRLLDRPGLPRLGDDSAPTPGGSGFRAIFSAAHLPSRIPKGAVLA